MYRNFFALFVLWTGTPPCDDDCDRPRHDPFAAFGVNGQGAGLRRNEKSFRVDFTARLRSPRFADLAQIAQVMPRYVLHGPKRARNSTRQRQNLRGSTPGRLLVNGQKPGNALRRYRKRTRRTSEISEAWFLTEKKLFCKILAHMFRSERGQPIISRRQLNHLATLWTCKMLQPFRDSRGVVHHILAEFFPAESLLPRIVQQH